MGVVNYMSLLKELGQATAQNLVQSLERADLHNTGLVSHDELNQALDVYKIALDPKSRHELLQQCTDGAQLVDYRLFLRHMGASILPASSPTWYTLFEHPIPKTPKQSIVATPSE